MEDKYNKKLSRFYYKLNIHQDGMNSEAWLLSDANWLIKQKEKFIKKRTTEDYNGATFKRLEELMRFFRV